MTPNLKVIRIRKKIILICLILSIFSLYKSLDIHIEIISLPTIIAREEKELLDWLGKVLFLNAISASLCCYWMTLYKQDKDIWKFIDYFCPSWLKILLNSLMFLSFIEGVYCTLIIFSITPAQNPELWNYWRERSASDGNIFVFSFCIMIFYTFCVMPFQVKN